MVETELSSFSVFLRASPTPVHPSRSLLAPDCAFCFVRASASATILCRNCVLSRHTRVLLGFTRLFPAARISRVNTRRPRCCSAAVIAERFAVGGVVSVDLTEPLGGQYPVGCLVRSALPVVLTKFV